jgi:hypothetical protein
MGQGLATPPRPCFLTARPWLAHCSATRPRRQGGEGRKHRGGTGASALASGK